MLARVMVAGPPPLLTEAIGPPVDDLPGLDLVAVSDGAGVEAAPGPEPDLMVLVGARPPALSVLTEGRRCFPATHVVCVAAAWTLDEVLATRWLPAWSVLLVHAR